MNHNSDQGPNGHGYRREESVEIEPVVKRVLEAAREGKIEKKDMALLKRNLPVWPPLRPSSVPGRTIRG